MADERVAGTLAWLRALDPPPVLSAIGRDGRPVPVPATLGLRSAPDRPITDGFRTLVGIETLHPDDRPAVLRAYERARHRGFARVDSRTAEGEPARLHFVDLRDSHGVILVATIFGSGPLLPVAPFDDADELEPPRVAWVRLDRDAGVIAMDDASIALLGWTREERIGQPALPFLHPDDHDAAIDNWLAVINNPGQRRRYRVRHRRPDGSWVWLQITNLNRLDDPEHGDVLSEMVDISEEMAAHDALRERERLLRELTDALPLGVVQFDAGRRVLHENAQLAAIVGGRGLDGLLAGVVDDDRPVLVAALDAALAGRVPAPVEVRLAGERVCRVTLRPLVDDGGAAVGGLACVDDVTDAARLRRQLEIRATVDELTACLTRSAILTALADHMGDEPGTGVVYIDLDRFKPVNDALGHAAGDEILTSVGTRLRTAVRDIDLVGRLGGDEFLVVCPGVASTDVVARIAERVVAALDAPLPVGAESVVSPHASVGVAWAPAGTDPDDLVARADAAMYESKRQSHADPNTPTKLTISPG